MAQAAQTLKSLAPRTNVARLERLFAIEKTLMRVQGARIPDLESWFLKQKIGYHLFEDAQHAHAVRARRLELQAGEGSFGVVDEDLQQVIEQILFAPGDYLFCVALYRGFKPLLVEAYDQHLGENTTYSDHPSRRVLQQIIAEEGRQMAWVEGALSFMDGVSPAEKQEGHEWVQRIREWVMAAGGLLGDGQKSPQALPQPRRYDVTKRARRESRQKATFEFAEPVEVEDAVARARLIQFMAYFREMAAAETMAVLLYEAPQAMPWEFFWDSARHFWDEIRHCQVGQQRLEELGVNIWDVPVQTGHYDTRAHMPLLESYAFLTQVQEAESFKQKRENEQLLRQEGDTLSADMIAYDMADERNHVRYGTKWIPHLQKVTGDTRSMEALVADARATQRRIWKELSGGAEAHPDGQY